MKRNDRQNTLELAIGAVEKQYGKGSLWYLGKNKNVGDVPSVPSGSFALDEALGIGGYPRGRMVEIYGPESSGKTTLALHAIKEVQDAGGVCAFVDAEHALDVTYAKRLGVDIENLLVAQPDYGEQALEIANTLVQSGGVDLLVIDSVAALVPKAELDGEMGDAQVGLQARMMSKAMRKMTGAINRLGATVVFINQLRHKIGVSFGSPETTTGGNALKFYASVRIDVRRIGAVKEGDQIIGNQTRAKVVKNKMAPPFREAIFEIRYGEGISRFAELIDFGVDREVLRKSGAYIYYGDLKLGQGREKTIDFLKSETALCQEIASKVWPKSAPGETEKKVA